MIERILSKYVASYSGSQSESMHDSFFAPRRTFSYSNSRSTRGSASIGYAEGNATEKRLSTTGGDPNDQKSVANYTSTETGFTSSSAETVHSNGNYSRFKYTKSFEDTTIQDGTTKAGNVTATTIRARSTFITNDADVYRTYTKRISKSDEEGNEIVPPVKQTVTQTDETKTAEKTTISDDDNINGDHYVEPIDYEPSSVWFSILSSTTSCNASYTTRTTASTEIQYQVGQAISTSTGIFTTTDSVSATGTTAIWTTTRAKRGSYIEEDFEFAERPVPYSNFRASYQTEYEAEINERLYARTSDEGDYGTVMTYGTKLTAGAEIDPFSYRNANGSGGRRFTTHPFRDVKSHTRTTTSEAYHHSVADDGGDHFDTEKWELVDGGLTTSSDSTTGTRTENTGIYYPRNSTSLGRSTNGTFQKTFVENVATLNKHVTLQYGSITLVKTLATQSFSDEDKYLISDPHSSSAQYYVNDPNDEDFDPEDNRVNSASTTFTEKGYQSNRHSISTSERGVHGFPWVGQMTMMGYTGFQSAGDLGTDGKIYKQITSERLPLVTANRIHESLLEYQLNLNMTSRDINAWGVSTSDGTIYAFSQDFVYSRRKYGDPEVTSRSDTSNRWEATQTNVNDITVEAIFEESDAEQNFKITQWTYEYQENDDRTGWRSRSNAITSVKLSESIIEENTFFYAKSYTKAITDAVEWVSLNGELYELEEEYSTVPAIYTYSDYMVMKHTQFSARSYFPYAFIMDGGHYQDPMYYLAGGLSPNGEAKGFTFVCRILGKVTCTLITKGTNKRTGSAKQTFDGSFSLSGTNVTTVSVNRNFSMQQKEELGGAGQYYFGAWDTGTFYHKDKDTNVTLSQQTIHPWDLPVGAILEGNVVTRKGEPPSTIEKVGNPLAPNHQQTTYKAYDNDEVLPEVVNQFEYTQGLVSKQRDYPFTG